MGSTQASSPYKGPVRDGGMGAVEVVRNTRDLLWDRALLCPDATLKTNFIVVGAKGVARHGYTNRSCD